MPSSVGLFHILEPGVRLSPPSTGQRVGGRGTSFFGGSRRRPDRAGRRQGGSAAHVRWKRVRCNSIWCNSGVKIHLLQTLKIVCIVCFFGGACSSCCCSRWKHYMETFCGSPIAKNLNGVAYFAFVLLLIAFGKIFPRVIF